MNTIDQLHGLGRELVGLKPAHPLQQPLAIAAMRLLNLRPIPIVGEPDLSDASLMLADIDTVVDIVDELIAAIGEYAASNFPGIDRSMFHDQLRGALEGNATFEIENAARNLIGDHRGTFR